MTREEELNELEKDVFCDDARNKYHIKDTEVRLQLITIVWYWLLYQKMFYNDIDRFQKNKRMVCDLHYYVDEKMMCYFRDLKARCKEHNKNFEDIDMFIKWNVNEEELAKSYYMNI